MVDKYDEKAGIRKLLTFVAGIQPNTWLCKTLLYPVLMSRFYKLMHANLGGRLQLIPDMVQPNGAIDYQEHGAYSKIPRPDDPASVGEFRHRSGCAYVLPASVNLSIDVEIKDNHSDELAKVEAGVINFQLVDKILWGKEFTRRWLTKKYQQESADKLQLQLQKQKEQVDRGQVKPTQDERAKKHL